LSYQRLLKELYDEWVDEVLAPSLVDEDNGNGWTDTKKTDQTLGLFYREGKERGYVVDTNSRVVRRKDPERHKAWVRHFREEPKEYLLDLTWTERREADIGDRLFLGLELEWSPVKPRAFEASEILDEDVEKLLDVRIEVGIAILGRSYRARYILCREDQQEVLDTFSKFLRANKIRTEFLFVLVDRFYRFGAPAVEAWFVNANPGLQCIDQRTYEELRKK